MQMYSLKHIFGDGIFVVVSACPEGEWGRDVIEIFKMLKLR